ncbi:hypothetical protein FA822_18475 [Escherichia coli]|nr:hypothetical protein [Escherichia coli]EFD4961517.1 hypothetical protein [Escherichia coli]
MRCFITHLILHTHYTQLSIHQHYAITCFQHRNIIIWILLIFLLITYFKNCHNNNNQQCSNRIKLQDNCFAMIRFLSYLRFSGS